MSNFKDRKLMTPDELREHRLVEKQSRKERRVRAIARDRIERLFLISRNAELEKRLLEMGVAIN